MKLFDLETPQTKKSVFRLEGAPEPVDWTMESLQIWVNAELIQYCDKFYQQHSIEIEPIYSGKLFYGIETLIQKEYFAKNSRILALHTGGLQGTR